MLAYLVLAGTNGNPVDPELIARFDCDDPPGIPFVPDERIVWRNDAQQVVFLGWQAFTEVAGMRSHWTVDAAGLTAFSGYCWPQDRGWVHGTNRSWAEQLRANLGDLPDLPELRESFFGQFTIISLPTTGMGWAMPDFAGADQLFVAEDAEVSAVSNRAALCAEAVIAEGEIPQRSLTGAGWLIAEGWMLDQESGFWDVERPCAGSFVAFPPHQSARVVEPPRYPFLTPEPEISPPSYVELLDESERTLRANIRAIADLPIDDLVLALSGGIDSRTLLAIILSEGVQDRFRFVTHGSPQRADAIAAKTIADRFRLNWTLEDASTRSPELELENALLHTGLSEGMTSAWATYVRPRFSRSATVSGVAGEGMRWMYVSGSAANARTLDDVRAGIRQRRPIDPMRVLRADARAYYQSWVDDWITDLEASGVPLVSIPAIYMHGALVHSRNGPDYAWSPNLRLLPFLSPACQRPNHRLPVDQRPSYRFHLDLQRSGSIELSKLPIAEATWTESAYAHLPDAGEYRAMEPVYSFDATGRTWRQKRFADYQPLIASILLDRSNPLQDLIDVDRMADRLATGDSNAGRTRQIWGALTAAIWMGSHEQLPRFDRS